MKELNRQQGIGLISGLFLLIVVGFIFLFFLRLFPIYYDKTMIQEVLTDVASEHRNGNTHRLKVWQSMQKKLGINDVEYLKSEDFKVERTPEGQVYKLNYDARTKLIGNIDLLVHFDLQSP